MRLGGRGQPVSPDFLGFVEVDRDKDPLGLRAGGDDF